MDPLSLAESRGANIVLATEISRHLVRRMIAPGDLIRVLDQAGVHFVLAGAYALNVWTDAPRATVDVDALVAARHHGKAISAIRAAYPELDLEDLEVVSRFISPESKRAVLDLMKPTDDFLREVFRHTSDAVVDGQAVLIPDVEMAAAMKFAAMVSHWRDLSKKYIDAGDFIAIVRANRELDREKLATLAELLYRGAGAEIIQMMDDAETGQRLTF